MSLEGRTQTGWWIRALPGCQFESEHWADGRDCREFARYKATSKGGFEFYVCEEHAQRLWDEEADGQNE